MPSTADRLAADVVRAAGDDITPPPSVLRQRPRWRSTLFDVRLETGLQRLAERHCLYTTITCINGPPWRPGNTARIIFFAMLHRLSHRNPPRGPRTSVRVERHHMRMLDRVLMPPVCITPANLRMSTITFNRL